MKVRSSQQTPRNEAFESRALPLQVALIKVHRILGRCWLGSTWPRLASSDNSPEPGHTYRQTSCLTG